MTETRYGIDQTKLKARCDARQAAEAALELICDSVAGDAQHFWKIIRDHAAKQLPGEPYVAGAMSNDEADRFARSRIPFGKHLGERIDTIPAAYLDWLAGETDDFKSMLQRYLRNERVRELLAAELEADDEPEAT